MATYTSIINSVLRKMRESQVATPNDTEYALLIGEFVNETKREVEDAYKWNALRSTIAVVTADGTAGYSITGAGKRFKLQDPTHSVYDITNKARIHKQNSQWMKERLVNNTDTSKPSYYYIEGIDGNGDPKVYFHTIPDDVYTINFELVIPQEDFTIGTEVLSIPDWPVTLGAYSRAIAERGEDNGRSSGEAMNKFQTALSDAITIDQAVSTGEDIWYVN